MACKQSLLLAVLVQVYVAAAVALPLVGQGTATQPQFELAVPELAVVQVTPQELWLVTPSPTAAMPKPTQERLTRMGVQHEVLDVQGAGEGLRLLFPRALLWQVNKQGKAFVLTQTQSPTLAVADDKLPPVQVRSRTTGQALTVYPTSQALVVAASSATPVVAGADPLAAIINADAATLESATAVVAPTVAASISLTQPHDPNQAVPFTLPESYAQGVPREQQLTPRSQAYLQAQGALEEALLSLARVAPPTSATQEVVHLEEEPTDPSATVPTAEDAAETPAEHAETESDIVEPDTSDPHNVHVAEPSHIVPHAVKPFKSPSAIAKDEIFLIKPTKNMRGLYRELEVRYWENLEQAKTGSDKAVVKLDFVRILITLGRAPEAEALLRTLPTDRNGNLTTAMSRALLAATLVLQERGREAVGMLRPMKDPEPHRSLWLAAALTQDHQYKEAADLFDAHIGEVSYYPNEMIRFLRTQQARALAESQQYERLFAAMEDYARTLKGDTLPRGIGYYIGRSQLELGDSDKGRATLSRVGETGEDKLAIQAKFDFLRDLERAGELSVENMIDFTESLRLFWRGDELEGKMLKILGDRYTKVKKYRDALNRYKTYAEAFPDAVDVDETTVSMRHSFLQAFAPENKTDLDNLSRVALYFDFRELTPADARGDRVIENIAATLDHMVLYHHAAELLEKQLDYRVDDPVVRARIGLQVATMHRKSQAYERALAVLDKWQSFGLPEDLNLRYRQERAQSLIALGRIDDAKAVVANAQDDVSRRLQVNIAWEEADYKTVARLLSQQFDTNEHGGIEDTQTRTDMVRLVYALAELKQKDALKQFLSNYVEDLRSYPDIADIVSIYGSKARLTAEQLPLMDGDRPLRRIAGQLLQLNALETTYDTQRDAVADRKHKRAIYNKKMDYMQQLRDEGLL
ncbi:MAG: hypothetical protein WAX89_03950 [Alphaproteobacteria bacterium]